MKTASLAHITKPSVPSSGPPVCLWHCNATNWNKEKETQEPELKEKRQREKKEEGEPDENWQPSISVMPCALPLVEQDALKYQLTSCTHSSLTQQPLPRKLSLLNRNVLAGHWQRGAW